MTETVPLVAEPPVSLGTIVYVPIEPTVKFPVCDFAIPSMAGAGAIVVGSLAVAVFVAPPPDAVAVFVSVPETVGVTVISMLGAT
jgi:hypothetical protein